MKDKQELAKEIIYQIYPKSFLDSNEDGIGDIKGIISKLKYFQDLGVTTLWICPFYKSPMKDNGYDIADFESVDPQFGTMEDLDELICEAKKINIKILIDLVINHTSDQHEWFKNALNDKNSKYRDYYIFKQSNSDGSLPNNWRSIFGGSVWEKTQNNDYYYHTFHKSQPDLNWENPELRSEIYKMVEWWLKKGIAGFRIDSITFIKKDLSFASLPADGKDGLVSCKTKTRNMPGISFFLNELKKLTFDKYDAITIGEAPGVPYEDYENYIGENGYFDLIFDFRYADLDVESGSDWFKRRNWSVKELRDRIFKSQIEIQKCGLSANFFENHDQPRSISKLIKNENFRNSDSAKMLGGLLLFLKGIPFIYQGEEIGMQNFCRKSIEEFDDISSFDNYKRAMQEGFSAKEALNFVNLRSRDNTRTPFAWNDERYAGFSSVEPWIKMTEEFPKINANNNAVLKFYKQLIKLRNDSKYSNIIIYGDFVPLDLEDDDFIAFKRVHNNQELIIICNFSENKKQIKSNEFIGANVLIDSKFQSSNTKFSSDFEPYQLVAITK